ncbi:unnamed protein product [Dracunculus medinensis]|uniref:ABC2_membrane domain-containing protein n=1 Tax=Dracunculus medinensis TaxID=318479 RepID=A0A0N4UJK0_DRAME|nr:unnamed protein product [Dracunculus medinensis]
MQLFPDLEKSVFIMNNENKVLQISLTIFGVASGPVLAIFCLGIFFPFVRKQAAFIGQLSSTFFCLFIAFGSIFEGVRPVPLPLDRSCGSTNISTVIFNASDPHYGMVEPLDSNSYFVQLFRVSYQYYITIAILVAFLVSSIAECTIRLIWGENFQL